MQRVGTNKVRGRICLAHRSWSELDNSRVSGCNFYQPVHKAKRILINVPTQAWSIAMCCRLAYHHLRHTTL